MLNKNNQSKILKSHSRARILKVNHKEKKNTEVEEKTQKINKITANFRKGIIDQIFNKNRQEIDTMEGKDEFNSIPESYSKLTTETYNNSPIMKKTEAIFEVNCSTIN